MSLYPDDERPVAGNQYVPDTMEAKGKIKVVDAIDLNMRNGMGFIVPMGMDSFEWSFDSLIKTELMFWANLCNYSGTVQTATRNYSQAYASLGDMPAFRLWDREIAVINYRYGVVDMPVWESYRNARFFNVIVRFSSLIPMVGSP